MIREGKKVSYVGDGEDGVVIGDVGKVVADAGDASHVRWASGSREGQITLVPDLDLVVARATSHVLADSMETALVSVAVRDVYDSAGEAGLLNALNDEGHLATFSQIAEEAQQIVATRLRTDPSMVEVLARLEPEEASEFITFTASVLLRDAFGGTDADV